MTDKLQRPEDFEFALDFLGDPEASELRAYIEKLEARPAPVHPEPEVGPTDEELLEVFYAHSVVVLPDEGDDMAPLGLDAESARRFARAALARWGRPAPAPAGEAGELVADHAAFAAWLAREMPPGTIIGDPHWWAPRIARRAASLLKLQAAPVPLLPEAAQVIEPTQHTILVPASVPVPVSERPWERDGWCDEQGQCWMGDPGGGGFIPSWRLCRPEDAPRMRVSLPFNALPLPSGEVG